MPKFIQDCKTFFASPFFRNQRTLFALWMFLPIIAAITKVNRCNNFLIFKYVFWHAWNGTSLYAPYPGEHTDVNHYGPLFSLVVAPFAIMPHFIGLLLWCVALSLFLYVAIRKSQFNKFQQIFILWFCAHELLTALFMQQFNIAIAAIILLSFYFIEEEQDFWAACMIMLGTFVKLYGVVGLAFFFFSKHKINLVGSLIFWAIVMFVAPMIFHGSDYLIGQYKEWYSCLLEKNSTNLFCSTTNISLLGMVRKITLNSSYSDIWLILAGIVLFCIPYLRISQYKNKAFHQTFLASTLMFVVLFSTGSESSGYITPLVGVVIWYTAAPWERTKWDVALLVFVFVLSSMSPSDLFPAYIRREFIIPYALKALPVVLVWLKLCYEMTFRDYTSHALKQSK
ncbi:MAG: DUF2029 domain-containing protein [Alphaproteobacteria bacterium]|nr:DUF2029 domain-containing protein [Alphaproteobacteria bacterium]